MNTSDDEPSSGLNGRLRPRKSAVQSPQTTKLFRRSESRSSQERPKRTRTPSKVLTKPVDLSNKSETSPIPHYLCPFCDKKFAAKQAISKHVHRIHSKQAPVMGCLFCNHAEAEPNDVIRHMVNSHPNQYFACLDCHTRFPSTTELAEHKFNVCEKQKLPYRNKLRQKTSKSKKSQKTIKIDDKDFETESKTFAAGHGFNGIVISCELKPSQVHDDDDIEGNITTNLILPPSKTLGSTTVLDKNAVIVLDDIQWNKRIPSNFSFHNTDADQILSRLGVVHRSPRTGESTRRDWLRTIDDATQKFEKCFDTTFYSKVASNVQENLTKFLDGSFNFNPDPDSMIKTRKSKMSVVINTAEGFPILLACDQYSRNAFDGYMPRAIAPRHKWKWDSLETDRTTLSADQIKRDSHTNNCIITLVSSLDIWTQLCMRRKYEEKYSYSPLAKKTDKQTAIENELKEILESREIPSSSSQIAKYKCKPTTQNDAQDFPSFLGLAPSTPKYELPPAVLSGEWVRPRCYVCCACGTPTYDSRGLSAHMATSHPNAQVQHYEVVGELLLNADILKHLYVPPSQMHNRTRPLRGIRECTKCKKSISLEDLHQHMLDCAGDTPAVRRKCRYRPFGVRKRRPRLPDNRIRKKIRKDIRNRQTNQKVHMRARPRANRSEVGDAETIRKMLADLPAKRHRVLVNPMNSMLRPKRKLDKHRNKLLMKRRQSEDTKNRKLRTIKTNNEHCGSSNEDRNNSPSLKYDDDDDKPLKRPVRRVPAKSNRQNEAMKRKAVLNRVRRKLNAAAEQVSVDSETPDLDVPNTSSVESNQLSIENNSQRLDVNSGSYSSRENSNRGSNGDEGSNNGGQPPPPPGHIDQSGNLNNQRGAAPNTPLKHSIERLTADCETHDKTLQFHRTFLIQEECNNLNQHVPSDHRLPFENEAAVTKLDKPPLAHSNHGAVDSVNIHKSKQNKVKRLDDCIAMLRMKNKLTDPTQGDTTTSQSVQCGSNEPLDSEPSALTPIEDKPAEIFHRHNINELGIDRQFERPYEYGKFISPINHPIPLPYEMIPMIMGMSQPEDLRVMHAMETSSKPKTRRQSSRAQQRRSTRQSMDIIPPMPKFMMPGNSYEMSMVPSMRQPDQVSQRRSSVQRIIVNINTETNRPPTLDLPSPNRLSPRQVSPRQISPRQMLMNAEMMREMSYDRHSPNKLSPLKILTPDVRTRSESRSPRQSHIYDPQYASKAGHRQISPKHSLDFDPRRVAMDIYQHSSQPSAPTQISPIQISQGHDKYSLYASKISSMPVSYRQTSPAPDHKAPKQISPMQESLPYDFHSSYKVRKQVSQAFDTPPSNKLPTPGHEPKHSGQAFDTNVSNQIPSPDQHTSKQTDRSLDLQLVCKASSLGTEIYNQASQPFDLQLFNTTPLSGEASSKQDKLASDTASKTLTPIQDFPKLTSKVSDMSLFGKVSSSEQDSSKPSISLDKHSSSRMPLPAQETSKPDSQAVDLQLSKKIASQDFDSQTTNKVPSPCQDTATHASQDAYTYKKLPSPGQGALKETSHVSDLQSPTEISSSDQTASKLAHKASEKFLKTKGEESSKPITQASAIQSSGKLVPKQVSPKQISQAHDKQSSVISAPNPVLQQENQVVEQPPSKSRPKEISPIPSSKVNDAQSHTHKPSLVSPKQIDQLPDVQVRNKSSPKDVLVKEPSLTQVSEITNESTKTRHKEKSSKHANQNIALETKQTEKSQFKSKTRASSRSSQGRICQTRSTRASSRALKLRSSSQSEDPVSYPPETSQTQKPHVQSQSTIEQSQLRVQAREPLPQMQEAHPRMQDTHHHTQETHHLQTPENHPQIREHKMRQRLTGKSKTRESHPKSREPRSRIRESQTCEQKTREPQLPMSEPHFQTTDIHPQTRENQTGEQQIQESQPQMQEPHAQMSESHPQTTSTQTLTTDHQTREQQTLEPQRQLSEPHPQTTDSHPQIKEHQTCEQKTREPKPQISESYPQTQEPQTGETKMREPHYQTRRHQSREQKTRDRHSQMRDSPLKQSDNHSQKREPQTGESKRQDTNPQTRDHQTNEQRTREPFPQIREHQDREHYNGEPKARESQVGEPNAQEPNPQMREHKTREPNLQIRELHLHTIQHQPQDNQMRENQTEESKARETYLQMPEPLPHSQGIRETYSQAREPQTRESHLEEQEPQSNMRDRQGRESQVRELRHQLLELHPQMRVPHPQMRDPYTQPREHHFQTEHHIQLQSRAQMREPHSHTPRTRSPSDAREQLILLREPHTQRQDTQVREPHCQIRESHGPPQCHGSPHEPRPQTQESYGHSQDPRPKLGEPKAQMRDSHILSDEQHAQLQESNAQPQSHCYTRGSHSPEECHSELREPQQREFQVQPERHATSGDPHQTAKPHIDQREHNIQARESESQEIHAWRQSHTQLREHHSQPRDSRTLLTDPLDRLREPHTQLQEPHTQLRETPPLDPSAKVQSCSQTKDSRATAKESQSLSRVSYAKPQPHDHPRKEPTQLRENLSRELHTQPIEESLQEPHAQQNAPSLHDQSRESRNQSEIDLYTHGQTLLQSQSQGPQRPYLLFAPPPPPPPPTENTQQVINQLHLEAQQQQWQSNVFDMSMIRQSSTDAANEHLARNMSVEMYSETEYAHMHPGVPLAHTGNLIDNLPSVPLDLSSKTPEACENARKLETSYVSHYERYETLDLSNKNPSLPKRDNDVVVDLRVKPTSQNSSVDRHELSGMPMHVDETTDLHDSIPRDLSFRQKHANVRKVINDHSYDVQDFSHKPVAETPTSLSGIMVPASSHYLLNNNETSQFLMTDQFSHNAKDRVPFISSVEEDPETANDFSGKTRNNIPSNLLSNIFIPPPPPPPPPREDKQIDEYVKGNSKQTKLHDPTSKKPECKLKTSTSNSSDLEEASEDFTFEANNMSLDVHTTLSVNTPSTSRNPGYTSPNLSSKTQANSKHDAEYALAKAFMSVSGKTRTGNVSTESLISRFSYCIPSTTAVNASSVYTLASSSKGMPSDSSRPSQVESGSASQINLEQDPETARKIALLPKELVEILGNMPPDHRKQLLNVLPQYVSHNIPSDQSNSKKQVDGARRATDLSKIPLPAGSGPASTTFSQNDPVSKFESPINYQNSMISDNRFSVVNLNASKLDDNSDSDVKQNFTLSSLPPLLCTINKSDDVKPTICDKITISDNKIEVINLETSETTTEVYNNPSVIDLTEDDNSPTNPIVNMVQAPEVFLPNVIVTPTVNLSNVTKVKATNEKTSSLRAVRIKTPSERHKSVSTDVPVAKTILENDSTVTDDNELSLRHTLAIQQSEVSSTQQQKKEAVKTSSQLSPIATEFSTDVTEPVKIHHDIPEGQQTIHETIENKSTETKTVLVTSSISTSGLLADKQSLNKIISSDLQVNLTPCDLNKTVLNENQKLKSTVSDDPLQSTNKQSTEAKVNAKGVKTVQEEDDDSDDDVSLAVIVKQKQLDHSCMKINVLDAKRNPERKEKRKQKKRIKKLQRRPLKKDVILKEIRESLNSSIDSGSAVNEDRDRNQNTGEHISVNDSFKKNIHSKIKGKHCKKKSKISRSGKNISKPSLTNDGINTQKQVLHKSFDDHNSVSSSSNKVDDESAVEMNVTAEASSANMEDEKSEVDCSQNKNKSRRKIVPKLSQSPLPIIPLKTKKISSEYSNSVLEKGQNEIRYDCKETIEPDSCSTVELPDTQDSLMQDSVNTEENICEGATESKKHKKNTRYMANKSKKNDSVKTSQFKDNLVTPLRRSRRGKSLFVDKLTDAEGIIQESDTSVEQKAPLTKKQLIFSKLLLDEENTKPQGLPTVDNPENCTNIPQSEEKGYPNADESLESTLDKSKEIEMEVSDEVVDKNKIERTTSIVEQDKTNELKSKNNLDKTGNMEATRKITGKDRCDEIPETPRVLEEDTKNEIEATIKTLEKSKATKRRQLLQVKRKVKKPKSVESCERTLQDMATDSSPQEAADSETGKVIAKLSNTNSDKETSNKSHSNEVTSELVNSENKAKLEINKPATSAEKRKKSEDIEMEQVIKNKKCKFIEKDTISKDDLPELTTKSTDKTVIQDNNTGTTKKEVRTTCYKPVAARRTRSKSAVVNSSSEKSIDPYHFDESTQKNEPIPIKGKYLGTKTASNSYLANTSTPIKSTTVKSQNKISVTSGDETLHDKDVEKSEGVLMDEDITGNISDSDDSSKSDVPLQKYLDEKGKRSVISPSKELDGDTDIEQELSADKNNSDDESSRKTLAACNTVEGGTGQSETEEQLRSEQFMESFGFFSERKPRKSNLLASKKISETFHIIANESDDGFGYRDRSSKKLFHENKKSDEGKYSKVNKRETRRGRKKKVIPKPEPCYCHICKKEFKRPDNFLRHQMSLIHISKLSEVELKTKTVPIHEEPNYLIAYKQYLDRLKVLTDKLAKKKKHKGSRKIKLPTVDEILADLNKTIREQQFSQRGLSNDEALFLDCCELLQEIPIKNEKSNADVSALTNACQMSGNNLQMEKNLDDTKSDGDVDSITAKTILESEEVRNLENDLIYNLKEAANANAAKYQQELVAEPPQGPVEPPPDLRDVQQKQAVVVEIAEKLEKPITEKSKREREILVDEKEFVYKEKMYPDIEDIDMFEDKFDKIKRKCRSQAAAAKQIQVVVEPSESHKPRRKSDKRVKKTKKSYQSSHVPTKGALKGFDGVKVSISPNDIPTTAQPAEEKVKDREKANEMDGEKDRETEMVMDSNMDVDKDKETDREKEQDREKVKEKYEDRDEDMEKDKERDKVKNKELEKVKDKEKYRVMDREKIKGKDGEKDKEKKRKKKGSYRKKPDKKDSESSTKYDSDQKDKETSTQKKHDVYEFMDNEDAELFEFRASTLMERFRNLSKEALSTSKSNPVTDELNISNESGSDGDDFVYMSDDYVCSDDETENSLLSCEMGSGKVGKEKTSSPLKRKDVVEKNAVMGKIFKNNAVRTEKKITKAKETAKPKANLDQLFDSLLAGEPRKGDSSPQKDLTEIESYSSLPGSTYEPSSSKYEPPSRYEPATSKLDHSTSGFEPANSTPSVPSTSKYEPTSSTSRRELSTSKTSTPKHDSLPSRYEQPSTSNYEPLTVTTRGSSDREFALPQKITPSHRYESMSSTSKRPQRPSLQAEEFRFSSRKYDSTDEDYGPSTSKRFETTSSDDYGPNSSKMYDMKSPKDCRLLSPKKYDSRKHETGTSKGNDCSTSRYNSSSIRNEDGSFKRRYSLDKSPMSKTDEGLSSTYDYGPDAGVARQRARRKCTVGKQNVLAESWSSESESERGPPRPTSAESVLSTGGRKKKSRKKESQPLGGRRGKVSFKRQEFESRVSSSNRNTSSSGAGCIESRSSYEEYGSGASSNVQVSSGGSGVKPRSRPAHAWPDGEEQEHQQQHGWIVGDSHKKLVTMLAHAKGRKRNNDDKRHLVE